MLRFLIALIVIGGLAAGGFFFWKSRQPKVDPLADKVAVVKVEKGKIRASISSTGRVVSNLDVDIKCKASGTIVQIPFDISDKVKPGDLLVELDPIDEQRNVKQSQNGLEASQAKLETAKQNLIIATMSLDTDRQRMEQQIQSAKVRAQRSREKADRLKQLVTTSYSATSKEEYDTAEAQANQDDADLKNAQVRINELKTEEAALEIKRQEVRLAQTDVEGDQISLAIANQRLTDTKVFSPMNGVVSARPVQKGTIISSAISNVGGGSTLMTLSDTSQLFILASVDESDIGNVKLGYQCDISADSFHGVKFSGKVVRIAPKGVSVSNVVTIEVKIEVLSPNKNLLMPEMTANVEIVSAEKDDVIRIPADAVTRKHKERFVQVSKPVGPPEEKNDTKEERKVEVGITDGVNIEITDGLTEGEMIVVKKSDADSRWKASPRAPTPGQMMGGRR